MKTCPRCELDKEEKEFGKSQSWCKKCHSDSRMESYWKNRDKELEYKRNRKDMIRLENHTKLREFLKENPCVDCGEDDPIVLELDHVTGEKKFSISTKMNHYRWDRLFVEIQKCEVRCANCHRRKTARDFNWYSFLN